MRLSFALFVSGILVASVEAVEPTRSLQWPRRGRENKRDGVDFNSTQSLPAGLQENPAPSSSSSKSSDVPSVSPPPAFPVQVEEAPPANNSSSSSSSSSELSSSSADLRPSDLPNNNLIASNTSESNVPAERPTPSGEEPSNASLGILVPTGGSKDNGTTDPGIWNSTATLSAEDSTITPAPFPQLNLTRPGFNDTGVVKNNDSSNCGSCVVNAQGIVDWWFPANVYLDVASISTINVNGTDSFSAVPLSTWTDIRDQLSQESFMFTEYTDPVAGTLVEDYIFTTLPPPVAASTSITTISGINPIPTGTFGVEEFDSLYIVPDTPSIVVDPAIPTAVTATQVNNVAWYTAYEVEFDESTTDESGAEICQKATSTYTLDQPYAYTLDPFVSFGDAAVATGDLDKAFLDYIPYASCTVGSWTAAPTMVVVVEVSIQRGFQVFLVHHEVSDPGALDTPTVTADNDNIRTDDSASVVSAVATVGTNPVTFQVTVTGNPASVTVPVGGSSLVASVIGGGSGNQGNNGNQGGGDDDDDGGLASAIISALGGGNQGGGNTGGGNTGGGGVGGAIGNLLNGGGATGGTGTQNAGGAGVGSVNGIGFVAPGTNTGANGGTGGGAAAAGGAGAVGGAAASPTAINFQGQTVTQNPQGAFVISGSSLVPGGAPITVGSNTLALNSNAQVLTVNNVPITAPASLPSPAPIVVVDGTTFRAEGTGQSFVIGGQTLQPGQQITNAGTTISLAADGSFVDVNGVRQPVASIIGAPTISVGGTAFTQVAGGFFLIDGTTIRPGQTSVVSGTTIAFGSDGRSVVVNGVTSQLALNTVGALVIGGTTYAATSGAGGYVIGSQTLKPGQVITANGHVISLSPNGRTVVVDGTTTVLSATTSLPARASAVATTNTSSRPRTPTGPSSGSQTEASAASTSTSAASSTLISHNLTLVATLLSFFGALCAWM